MKLYDNGWGYTKIHTYLLKNGSKIGKSRSTVDSIIKKIKKRKRVLSQKNSITIKNFQIKMYKD